MRPDQAGREVGVQARQNPLAADLDHVLTHTRPLWEELRGRRLFITGGTGFIGSWLLESLLWANDRFGLGVEATVLTRTPEAFRRRAPHLADQPAVTLHAGDVKSFAFPAGEFPYLIHAATESSTIRQDKTPLRMIATIVDGTRRVLDFAANCGTRKLLFLSSGAVYGPLSAGSGGVSEDYGGGPNLSVPASAYGEGKRLGELLCAAASEQYGFETKIARCFAFMGPYLPLDGHFAVGNFILDVLQQRSIRIHGDGSAVRSYLYASDLSVWLWTVLFRGKSCTPYNVGSEETISIRALAEAVSKVVDPPMTIEVNGRRREGTTVDYYAPSTARARTELGLRQHISLEDAIRGTLKWCALAL